MADKKRSYAATSPDETGDVGSYAEQNGSKRLRTEEQSPAAGPPSTKSVEEQIAAAKARAAAVRERLSGKTGSASQSPSTTSQSPAEAARAKIEAMKARVAAATAKSDSTGQPRTSGSTTVNGQPSESADTLARARGGLGVGLHPALLGDSTADGRSKAKGPITSRFSTTMGNRRNESYEPRLSSAGNRRGLDSSAPSTDDMKQNPYFDPSVIGNSVAPKTRKSRELLFHQKGKFIAQATALRRQAQLEDMKRRIAESARKAGLDEDRSEQAFVVPEPPSIEWWDEGLVNGSNYPEIGEDDIEDQKSLKISTEDTVITRYIQHPVLLEPPQDKTIPPPKPMFMTKQEQAKKRRQDRTEIRKEKQAKVRLGLEPPEPPKVKKSNLMRVLGEQAVKDPTAVETRVNREIAERRHKHEEVNEERKLTKEQRNEKLAANQEKDANKGILVSVYRIDSLAYGKHRYQVDVNAKQHALTGIAIMNPKFNLVIVEGGEYSISKYRKLMLQRIKWTENAPPTETAVQAINTHHKDISEASFLKAEDEKGQLKDLSHNQCVLVWEGEEKQRSFKKWGSKVCDTDAEARRTLEKSKMENMWQLAKNWNG